MTRPVDGAVDTTASKALPLLFPGLATVTDRTAAYSDGGLPHGVRQTSLQKAIDMHGAGGQATDDQGLDLGGSGRTWQAPLLNSIARDGTQTSDWLQDEKARQAGAPDPKS